MIDKTVPHRQRWTHVVAVSLATLVAVGLSEVQVRVLAAHASCAVIDTPLTSFTGVAVDASPQQFGEYLVEFQGDDGSILNASFLGGAPQEDDEGNVVNFVEDAYTGLVPEVGGRYTVTGLRDGKTLHLNACVPGAAVSEVAAPPKSATPTSTTSIGANPDASDDTGASPTVWIIVAALATVGVAAAMRHRRNAIRSAKDLSASHNRLERQR